MKKIYFLFILLFIPFVKVKAIEVSYQTHVQSYGWMESVSNGELSGTTGEAKRLEAIKINIENSDIDGSIDYQVHVQSHGWMESVSNGELSGTTGEAKRLEAIKISLSGAIADYYKVMYRVHVQSYGWLPWVSNGELAGTTGEAKRLEAIEIKLVSIDNRNLKAKYSVHNIDGWTDYLNNGEEAGTTGQAKAIDLIKIKLDNNTKYSGGIEYSTFIYKNDWLETVDEDKETGIENEKLEAIKINLTGEFSEKFNIFYRVHVSSFGWLDWTKNGLPAGTRGYFKQIEAIEIKVLPIDDDSISISDNSYKEYDNKVIYSTHVQSYGWMDEVSNGELSGTTGEGKRVESIKIKLDSTLDGSVIYQTYIEKRGWSSNSKNGEESGTSGLARKLEGISIKLEGRISEYYDIYYRVHMQSSGWLSWAKNGGYAGSFNSDKRMEAVEIKLVYKDASFNDDTSKPYITGTWINNNTSYKDAFGNIATGFKVIDGVKYFFDGDGTFMVKNAKKVIDVSSWQDIINWDTIKRDEDVDEAIIRVGWGTSYGDECGLDSMYNYNIQSVQRLNIPYGVYIYAYAVTTKAAEVEADYVISNMEKYNVPKSTMVWYDAEIQSIPRDTYNTVIKAFVNRMKSKGYNNVGVYGGVGQLDTTNGNLNTSEIRNYPIWVAQYYKKLQYEGYYTGWQFSSTEYINGIEGNVDVSVFR